jgi:hypothetical protein
LDIRTIWSTYQKKYAYANGIEFDDIVQVLKEIMDVR